MPARFTCYLLFLLLALFCVNEGVAQIQIVNCDAPVQSRKRGIGVNSLSDADFRALAPGVSWYYNWSPSPLAKPADVVMDFLPMAWNGDSGSQATISAYLAAGNRPWRVFALNEPNLLGQAFMTPSNSAIAFKQVKAICDPYNIPVISPHMAEGTATGDSITAYDPLQKSNVTYTSQEPFLKAFFCYCSSNTPATPAGISDHSYAGYNDLTYWTGLMHTDFPTQTVWVTEFNASASSDATALANLIPCVDYCERTRWIEGYSWFMVRINGNAYNSLLSSSGVLTAAGQAYIQMPVHDTNLFYRIPGRLQAERYVVITNMSIAPTTDATGLADMISSTANGSLDYNIQVDSPGNYPLSFRVASAIGQIKVYKGGTLLGTAANATTGWSTVSTTVSLSAGAQTLHIVLAASSQKLNWMEFQPANGMPSIPTGLTATAGDGQVALSWAAATAATSYNLKRGTVDGGPYTSVTNVATTNYTQTGLINGTTYYFVVSATNAVGESSDSVQASATPALPTVNVALYKPTAVSSVENATLGGTNAVDGNSGTRWASATTNTAWIYVDLLATYNIQRVKLNWEAAYGSSYQIQVSSNAVDWVPIYSTITGNGGVDDLTGLSGTGRYVRMYGTAHALTYGFSLYDFEVYATILTGMTATAGDSKIALNWDAFPGATSYNLKRGISNGGPYPTVINVTSVGYTNNGLVNGTTYYYVVSVLNGLGETPNSTQVSATPALAVPPPPTGLTGIPDYTQAALSWTASPGATSYNVKSATNSGGSFSNVVTGLTLTTYTNTGLLSGTTNYYVVSAVNGAGEGANSLELAVVTLNNLISQTNAILNMVDNKNGTFTLNFVGTVGVTYYVQTATNLATPVYWLPLTGSTNLVTNSNGSWFCISTNSAPQSYYRSAVAFP